MIRFYVDPEGKQHQETFDPLVVHYSCGCGILRDHDGSEYVQPSMFCVKAEHLKRVVNPRRDTRHLWEPGLFDGD